MKLYMSHTSPFARKVRMTTRLTGLADQVEEICTTFESAELRERNPLGKIPALEASDITLFDSALICEYLDEHYVEAGGDSLYHGDRDDYYPLLSALALANGITEAAVSTIMETKRETEHSTYWLERWNTAMETGVRTVDVAVLGTPAEMNMAGIAMAACLGYLDFRLGDHNWRVWNPALADWFHEIAQQRWFTETAPPEGA
ncbi:glutathione S-transferase family protein [Teredinibacter turnerae]|uniref:glutathione S-transferase family protein n=1 Tax=Teredinibacter turnerae TaxID=2426 RepID=UPI000374B4AA|nr:glutathione S-transferase N-terminal domain-containing protein [Teredinibacter turnerae]